jgi:hypothetical protein
MNEQEAFERIQDKFIQLGSSARIPLLKGGSFKAQMVEEGILVDNLGNQSLLRWIVFLETVKLLNNNGGRALRGDAMQSKLGSPRLPLNSIEGHISHVVYGKQIGDSIFRRITPIACILIWAGVCRTEPTELILRDSGK